MLWSLLWQLLVCNKKVIGLIWKYMYSFWCVVNIALLTSRKIPPHQNSYIYFHIQPITYNSPPLIPDEFHHNFFYHGLRWSFMTLLLEWHLWGCSQSQYHNQYCVQSPRHDNISYYKSKPRKICQLVLSQNNKDIKFL